MNGVDPTEALTGSSKRTMARWGSSGSILEGVGAVCQCLARRSLYAPSAYRPPRGEDYVAAVESMLRS